MICYSTNSDDHMSGLMARVDNIENFAAEDVLHMGSHFHLARSIGCRVAELPLAEDTYSIQSGRLNTAGDCTKESINLEGGLKLAVLLKKI